MSEGKRPTTRRPGGDQQAGAQPPGEKSGKGAQSPATAAEVGKALEAQQQAEEQAREAQEKYLRAAAEMENMRRRHRQEQTDRLQYANAELIGKILPVLDNFDRALEHAPSGDGEANEQWLNGLLMVERQLRDLLEQEGVIPIEALGQPFDPSLHQAVLSEPSPAHEDGMITAELQRGYFLNDRVLRPSLVKVARNA